MTWSAKATSISANARKPLIELCVAGPDAGLRASLLNLKRTAGQRY